jgi:4-hydroxy-3-methylbut-2-en-1-yl diphosphate synthase IspG/GcpE
VNLQWEPVDCPACGRHGSAMVVEVITPTVRDALTPMGVRDLGTITCPACGSWVFDPPRVSATGEREPSGSG